MIRVSAIIFSLLFSFCSNLFAADEVDTETVHVIEPRVGSWIFSGMVTNESGTRYGYFFQMQRQGSDFHVKTALIDGQTNQLAQFYEHAATIDDPTQLNWQVGRSFIRFNPINDSWVFGVKAEHEKGFNFKVDMLKQINNDSETIVLRPGIELQALQTSRLNGHIQMGAGNKEQFVTGNSAWFGKVWFSQDQEHAHDISTTFCRLSNDNGFYSANLKEPDATGAAIAGWLDATGNRVKMSQFISIKELANNQCVLRLGLPKLRLNVLNTLKREENAPFLVAGFSKENPKSFCFVTEQSFIQQIKKAAVDAVTAVS